MPVDFTLPELGENVEKGDVVRVLVTAGDVIAKDQPLLELETDKATIEVPSTLSGKVAEVRVKAGDKVKVGQTVLTVDEGASGGNGADPKKATAPADAAPAEPPAAAAAAPDAPSEVRRPEDKTGGHQPDDARAEQAREATDAQQDQPSRPAPVVNFSSARQAAQGSPAPAPARVEGAPPVPAAPSVRRYARELGVEIGEVPGTGPGGRIGQQDVKQHVKAVLTSGSFGGRIAAGPLPDFGKWGEVEVKPMSNIRRKTAEHLSIAWQAPHVTQHDKADVTALEQFRAAYGKRVEKAGGKLTVTAILIKVCALALDRFPEFASSVDMARDAIVFKKYRHIGVAVDTPNGLLVPVIRDVDRKTIGEIAAELGEVSQKARDRKLSLEEMSGGVFSISNLGGIGGTAFTPIINQPEVAILGVSRGSMEPVWRDGEFVAREMLPLSLSYDHRVIDGADAARFLRFVAEALEQPMTIYL
jgi:pyruvate dehydrogenase E2 component (dihydrolipoamide acetyltransferase)